MQWKSSQKKYIWDKISIKNILLDKIPKFIKF